MKKKRSYKRIICHISMGIVFLIIGILGSYYAFSKGYNYTLGVMEESRARILNPNIKQITLTITPQTQLNDVADILYENNFIAQKTGFLIENLILGSTENLIPGEYLISSNMPTSDIMNLITKIPKKDDTIKFTIPEGFSIIQIANRLHDEGIVDREEFLNAVNERDYDFSFLEFIPSDSKYKLEGYLFPDTYIVNKGASPEEIIMKMLNRFEQVISKYSKYLRDTPYNLHEVLTIASIIEQEAKLSQERPIISGVIYNRLSQQMKLQMCSSVQYVLEKRQANLSYEDLKVDSPYNTYIYGGLPLGPICSPGQEAIEAALIPENHNYYFFVLKDTKSGAHAFSDTAAGHEQNKLQYQQSIDKNFYE